MLDIDLSEGSIAGHFKTLAIPAALAFMKSYLWTMDYAP